MDGWTDRWSDGWIDGWIDGWMCPGISGSDDMDVVVLLFSFQQKVNPEP